MDISIYKASPPTLTDGMQTQPLVDSAGNAKVALSGAGTAGTPAGGVQSVQGAGLTGTPVNVRGTGTEYETVAAGQTAQVLGATGAAGDYLSHVVLQPAAVGAGTTTILDNATVIFTYTAGTLADLRPITVPVNAFSVSGAWKITTGANMAAVAFGDFT
jgi:hypothetical protein